MFNHIKDENVNIDKFVGKAEFFVTHVQLDELLATSDDGRREALSQVFKDIPKNKVPTESFVLDISRLDEAKLGNDSYEDIKAELDSLKRQDSNAQDALMAETAIKNQFTLVTGDRYLFAVTTKFKGAVINLYQLLRD